MFFYGLFICLIHEFTQPTLIDVAYPERGYWISTTSSEQIPHHASSCLASWSCAPTLFLPLLRVRARACPPHARRRPWGPACRWRPTTAARGKSPRGRRSSHRLAPPSLPPQVLRMLLLASPSVVLALARWNAGPVFWVLLIRFRGFLVWQPPRNTERFLGFGGVNQIRSAGSQSLWVLEGFLGSWLCYLGSSSVWSLYV
jgi:hypothetical protein